MLLEAFYSVLMVVLELPTGYFADVRGRKASLIVSTTGYGLALAFFMFGQSFFEFAAAMVLWAVSGAFRSGADNAFIYDTLLSLKREKEFPKISGRAGFLAMVAGAVASLVGGYFADIRITFPFVLTVAAAVLALIVVALFKEPPREKPIVQKGHVQKLAEVAKDALANRTFLYLVFYNAFLVPVAIVLYYLLQPLVVQLGLPLTVLGLLYAAIIFTAAVGMLIAPHIYYRINIGVQLLAIVVLACAATVSLALSKSVLGLGWLLLMALSVGTVAITISTAVNQITSSDKRATVLSLFNMISQGVFLSLFSVAIGRLIDLYSLRSVTLVAAVISLIGGSIFSLLLAREKTLSIQKKSRNQNSLILSNSE